MTAPLPAAPPRHVAVIPDGNRRWARARGQTPAEGHAAGIAAMAEAMTVAWEAGVSVFTFWWGSPANLTGRPADEVAAIIHVLGRFLEEECPAHLKRHDARFRMVGRWRELAPSLAPAVDRLIEDFGEGGGDGDADAHGDDRPLLVVLFAYDGRDELLAAARQLGGDGGGPEAFEAALWTAGLPPVDLVVRTGGDQPHLSAGFMVWSIAEAWLAFPDVLWPDFRRVHFEALLEDCARSPRRFGR